MSDLSRRVLTAGSAGGLLGTLASPALALTQPSLRGRDSWLFFYWDDPVRMEIGPTVARVTAC
jgi:hypothetical protein